MNEPTEQPVRTNADALAEFAGTSLHMIFLPDFAALLAQADAIRGRIRGTAAASIDSTVELLSPAQACVADGRLRVQLKVLQSLHARVIAHRKALRKAGVQ